MQSTIDFANALLGDARIDYVHRRVIEQHLDRVRKKFERSSNWLSRVHTPIDSKAILDGANMLNCRLQQKQELSDEVKQIVRQELIELLKDQAKESVRGL